MCDTHLYGVIRLDIGHYTYISYLLYLIWEGGGGGGGAHPYLGNRLKKQFNQKGLGSPAA